MSGGFRFASPTLRRIPIMKKVIFICLAILFVSIAIISAFWLVPSFQKEVVYIAVAVPMSGEAKEIGKEMLEGVHLCLKKISKKGGIDGRKVKLRIYDDKNDEGTARKIAAEISEQDDTLMVIGHYSSEASIAAGRVYREKGIPAITASASSELVTYGNKYYFSTVPGNSFQGRFIANYISKVLKEDTVSIIFEEDYYGSNIVENFQIEAAKLNMTIRMKGKIDSKAENSDAELERLVSEIRAADDPGIIFAATHVSAGAMIVKSLKYPGSSFTVVGPDSFAGRLFLNELRKFPQERLLSGYYSDGIYAVSPFIIDIGNEDAQVFKDEFVKKYDAEPGWIAAGYYDAMLLALKAIENAGIEVKRESVKDNREKIRDYLAGLYNYETSLRGVNGDIYFDRNGNVNRPLAVGAYRNQKLISEPSQYQPVTNLRGVDNMLKEILEGRLIKIDDHVMMKTRLVYTGIDINEISDLNVLDESYVVDFYLWFRYEGEFDCENIEFVNADNIIELDKSKQTLRLTNDIINKVSEKKTDDFTVKGYRIRAAFQSDFDFHAYPFDRQTLRVQFRHASETRDKLIYISDIRGMRFFSADEHNTDYNALRGWEIDRESFFQDIITNDSTLGDPAAFDSKNMIHYSQYNASVRIKRQLIGFLFKNIFSVFIMIMTLYLVYFIQSDQFELRLSIGMGVLMTNAFLHQDVSSNLQVGYVLAIDYAFFTVYGLSTLSIVASLAGSALIRKGAEESACQLNVAGRIIHPGISLAVTLIIGYLYVWTVAI